VPSTTFTNPSSYNVSIDIVDSIPTSHKHPGGIPGKWFVLPFVASLVLLGGLTFAMARRFQTIIARLEESRSLWPAASLELGPRYDQLNESINASKMDPAFTQGWTNNRKEFKVSSQFDRQSAASLTIENQIRQNFKESERDDSDFKSPGISKLIESEGRRKKAQDDIIGWLTVQGLRLKLPPIYDPLAKNQ
jgi:hypothetical protein